MTRRAHRVAAVVVMLAAVVAGCSSSSDDAAESPATTRAPEEILVPNAQVTAGLADLGVAFQQAQAAIEADSATVDGIPQQLNDQWFAIEGRIKKNDEMSYIAFEDALALMTTAANDGDDATARRAAQQFSTTADSYLARFP